MSGIQRFLVSRQISRPQIENTFNATGGSIVEIGGYKIHTFSSGGNNFNVTSGSKNIDVLVVAGGGAGGASFGGAGGGGGLIYTSISSFGVGSYTATVGAGGGKVYGNTTGNRGSDSVFHSLTAIGGGGGGCQGEYSPGSKLNGGSGGSPSHNSSTKGFGTAGQGNDSGNPYNAGSPYANSGGGGAGQTGFTPGSNSISARGGNGLEFSISGASTYYAGGGGGGGGGPSYNVNTSSATGGLGGGGAGGPSAGSDGVNGQVNTGGGGGGSHSYNDGARSGGSGGSGIVIVRYIA